ncbi:hypothetical protein VIBNIAM115_790044 [Vibrio nigripulchritudo AM115]|nr:hypothetical protein VIBNIAM115_790044 [Vibrio nigripulchritudo AM115]
MDWKATEYKLVYQYVSDRAHSSGTYAEIIAKRMVFKDLTLAPL